MPMTEINDAYDSPWKDVLEAYFQDFMQFFFPDIHAEIDWSRGYEFLDQELSQIVRDADLGKRLADKLVKVWKLNGEETWVCYMSKSRTKRRTSLTIVCLSTSTGLGISMTSRSSV
jgi:hypothetical protein